ncbi:hypothetical protein [Clostridium beijerinckii]|uniref:Nitrogen fixation/metabolism regulation signal transduction histidine kinase n=1 Tax=Clostridium beijerinckii TaxID=1520 RepID=A0AAE5LPR1_CLOBE|nr:hypothetical protein [Clostridium beijerinckii]NSB13739.1 nitrogen fixation/metabolism regulation signal transduction histidine kinase [Clostridium beijerinckii]OOM29593.1 hypothetical protein CLOBE_21290 [Clostridium beijerinckii]
MSKTLLFTKVIYSIFFICTIITCIIVYGNIDNSMALKFVISYAVFALFMLLYVPIITLFNARKLKRDYLRKVLSKFAIKFVIFFALNCVFDYIFKSPNVDMLNAASHAVGLSFGLAFLDVTFLDRRKK